MRAYKKGELSEEVRVRNESPTRVPLLRLDRRRNLGSRPFDDPRLEALADLHERGVLERRRRNVGDAVIDLVLRSHLTERLLAVSLDDAHHEGVVASELRPVKPKFVPALGLSDEAELEARLNRQSQILGGTREVALIARTTVEQNAVEGVLARAFQAQAGGLHDRGVPEHADSRFVPLGEVHQHRIALECGLGRVWATNRVGAVAQKDDLAGRLVTPDLFALFTHSP